MLPIITSLAPLQSMKRLALSKPIIEPTDSPNKIQPISAFDTANISRVVAVLEIHVANATPGKANKRKEHFERQVISFMIVRTIFLHMKHLSHCLYDNLRTVENALYSSIVLITLAGLPPTTTL